MIELVAFDADDTLWHNEIIYQETKAGVIRLLAEFAGPEQISARLDEIEMRNLAPFGYGAKAFTLSLVETAISISGGRVPASVIQQIIDLGRAMLGAEVQVLEGVEQALARLAGLGIPLMVITKGELLDQEAKLRRSGLGEYFNYVEVVSDKTVETYRRILERRGVAPGRFLMVGNSLKSDILPVIRLGGYAVYVPHELTWSHELNIEEKIESERYYEVERVELLPELLAHLK